MKLTAALIVLALLCANAADAQTLATVTTGSVSSEGEGGLFMLAGTDVSRFGVMTRFALSNEFDIGIQLALDRYEETSHYGGGIDLKYELPIETGGVPIHIAFDMGVGDLESGERRRILLAAGFLVSGVVESARRTILEPYAGIYVLTTRSSWKGECPADGRGGCWEGTRSDTEPLFRAGTRIPLGDDWQVLVEASIDGETMFGAGINLVF